MNLTVHEAVDVVDIVDLHEEVTVVDIEAVEAVDGVLSRNTRRTRSGHEVDTVDAAATEDIAAIAVDVVVTADSAGNTPLRRTAEIETPYPHRPHPLQPPPDVVGSATTPTT